MSKNRTILDTSEISFDFDSIPVVKGVMEDDTPTIALVSSSQSSDPGTSSEHTLEGEDTGSDISSATSYTPKTRNVLKTDNMTKAEYEEFKKIVKKLDTLSPSFASELALALSTGGFFKRECKFYLQNVEYINPTVFTEVIAQILNGESKGLDFFSVLTGAKLQFTHSSPQLLESIKSIFKNGLTDMYNVLRCKDIEISQLQMDNNTLHEYIVDINNQLKDIKDYMTKPPRSMSSYDFTPTNPPANVPLAKIPELFLIWGIELYKKADGLYAGRNKTISKADQSRFGVIFKFFKEQVKMVELLYIFRMQKIEKIYQLVTSAGGNLHEFLHSLSPDLKSRVLMYMESSD